MKSILITLIPLLSATIITSALAEDYIIQTDLTPVAAGSIAFTAKIDVDGPDGVGTVSDTIPAAFPVGKYGSRFDLYTTIMTNSGDRVFHLGTSVIGPYPSVSISMTSEDPYVGLRTRADKRFGASITVSGIMTDPLAPNSMKQLYVEHLIDEFTVGTYSFSPTDPANWRSAKKNSSGDDAGIFVVQDGTYTITIPDPNDGLNTAQTSLTSPNDADGELTQYYQCGQEKVIVYARPSVLEDWVAIADKTMTVYPLAQAEIFASNDNYASTFLLNPTNSLSSLPSIYGVCKELYPTSVTSIRLYKGTKDNIGALVITDLELVDGSDPASFNTIQPQDGVLMLNNTAAEIVDLPDGDYFVELVTVTPFNNGDIERVAWAEFKLKRSINVRAGINTQK